MAVRELEARRLISSEAFAEVVGTIDVFTTRYYDHNIRSIQRNGPPTFQEKRAEREHTKNGWKIAQSIETTLSSPPLSDVRSTKKTERISLDSGKGFIMFFDRVTDSRGVSCILEIEAETMELIEHGMKILDSIFGPPVRAMRQVFDIPRPENLKIYNIAEMLCSDYTVTYKADGVTAFLHYGPGLKIVQRDSVSVLIEGDTRSILIGELIDPKTFSPFDVIDRESEPSSDALERVRSEWKDTPHLRMIWKPFIPIGSTRESLAAAFRAIKEIEPESKTDGFIFTPNLEPPTRKTGSKIFKYKPWNQLTIDVLIIDGFPMVWNSLLYVRFEGNQFNPLNAFTVPPKAEGRIVEVGPTGDDGLKFIRYREDKKTPNSQTTALSVWEDIARPLHESVLLAEDFKVLFHEQNIIKKKLIESVIVRGKSLVIDIGTGWGGDIAKYDRAGASIVLAVEPNAANREELRKRLERRGKGGCVWKVFGHEGQSITGTEEMLSIFRGREVKNPIVVSMMLSMSFFWKDRETVNQLKAVLKRISDWAKAPITFICYTIHGPSVRDIEVPGVLKIETSEEDVTVSIPGTIVGEGQKEYRVNVDDLGLDLREISFGTPQHLTANEKIYFSFFKAYTGTIP